MNRLTANQSWGFSLIELLTVLLIISLLTAVGSVSLSRWQQRQQVRITAGQLQHFLIKVRQQANWNNQTLSLWTRTEGDGWCIGASGEGEHDRRCNAKNNPLVWQPAYPQVVLKQLIGQPLFWGEHDTARAGSIEITNGAVSWRIIISTYGRIRCCESKEPACRLNVH